MSNSQITFGGFPGFATKIDPIEQLEMLSRFSQDENLQAFENMRKFLANESVKYVELYYELIALHSFLKKEYMNGYSYHDKHVIAGQIDTLLVTLDSLMCYFESHLWES